MKTVTIRKIKKLYSSQVTSFKEGETVSGEIEDNGIKINCPLIIKNAIFSNGEMYNSCLLCNQIEEIVSDKIFKTAFSVYEII